MDLNAVRERINAIDDQIVDLFVERMKASADVASAKAEKNLPVLDLRREQAVLEKVMERGGEEFEIYINKLYQTIFDISKSYQAGLLTKETALSEEILKNIADPHMEFPRKAVVACQGVEGSYGHGAARRYFGPDADMYHVKTMEDAMTEVEEGRADYAVLPIENSSAGAVSDNYDLLVKHNVYIAAETELPINHALLGREDADIKDIRTVYSHPQALMQTSQYLNAHRDWKQISTVNTAVAAKKVAEENDRSQAAVASEIAGELYGLKVLERSINHNKNNVTRFIILSKDPVYRKGANKVSICFEGVHRSGSLYNMLGNLIYNDINMLMIESRPIPERSWEYRFFVDVEGSLSDAKIRNALKGISEEAVSLRILGNY